MRLTYRDADASPAEKRVLALLPVNYPADAQRPRTRGECADGPRPCPWVSCRHHLYLEVKKNGNLVLPFPDKEPDEIGETCSLDVADRGEHSLDEVGALVGGVTRERVRQIEAEALAEIAPDMRGYR